MDVHGAEGKILNGSKNLLNNNIKYILMEMHTEKDLNKFSPGYTNQKLLKILLKRILIVTSYLHILMDFETFLHQVMRYKNYI